jgi:hypothetical protein
MYFILRMEFVQKLKQQFIVQNVKKKYLIHNVYVSISRGEVMIDYEQMWEELKEWVAEFPDNQKYHPEYQRAMYHTMNKMEIMEQDK